MEEMKAECDVEVALRMHSVQTQHFNKAHNGLYHGEVSI